MTLPEAQPNFGPGDGLSGTEKFSLSRLGLGAENWVTRSNSPPLWWGLNIAVGGTGGSTVSRPVGAKVQPSRLVGVMGHVSSTSLDGFDVDEWLSSLIVGERGRALKAQLAGLHPLRSDDEIREAIQTACTRLLAGAGEFTTPPQTYSWVRLTAHRLLNREDRRHRREPAIDPGSVPARVLACERPGPAEELIESEDEDDVARFARTVSAGLPERARRVWELHSKGVSRHEIADRLGVSERVVKREVEEILRIARDTLIVMAGNGCADGEGLVARYSFGLGSEVEASRAELHLSRCEHCSRFHQQLALWREKVGALAPLPVMAATGPGLIGRASQKSLDVLGSLKQQAVDVVAQAKQHAASSYYRVVDPTPFAGARPGTAAVIVAGCISLGGGATYCVDQGVNPFRAAQNLIAPAKTKDRQPEAQQAQTEPPAPVTPPPTTPVTEPEPVAIPEPEPEPTPEPEPVPEPAPEPAPPPPPPPEQEFEPASPDYRDPPQRTPVQRQRPAPVADDGVPEFGGP